MSAMALLHHHSLWNQLLQRLPHSQLRMHVEGQQVSTDLVVVRRGHHLR